MARRFRPSAPLPGYASFVAAQFSSRIELAHTTLKVRLKLPIPGDRLAVSFGGPSYVDSQTAKMNMCAMCVRARPWRVSLELANIRDYVAGGTFSVCPNLPCQSAVNANTTILIYPNSTRYSTMSYRMPKNFE